MGAHNFTTYVPGVDVEAAYCSAVAEAIADRGHSSYNGTISTTDGYLVLGDTPIPLQEALDQHASVMDNEPRIEKRGPCGAIPVLDTDRLVTAPIPAKTGGYSTKIQAIETALAGLLQPGERIADPRNPVPDGRFIHHGETRKIISGFVTVTLTGGRPTHAGWLFFGWAVS
ncbi:hypothetical protein OG339_48015 (plasmid) [Streptosporangium sp. NBC_01495]|uniref:hypothetical protein n=1 Tax=Streptosporangium sp. NBC_01495 TaxID=2903899 RepID=UPI002E363573|nr:hypothetical protein [Streptosporangium sp. NBC_01495]